MLLSRISVLMVSLLNVYTYIKIGTIQRRLAWPLRKDDTQIREAFQIFSNLKRQCSRTLAMLLINMWDAVEPAVCWLKLGRARPCCSDLVLQHGRGEREQMASSSVPPQAKTALLVTNF